MKRDYYISLADGAIAYGTPCAVKDGVKVGSQACITCPHFIAIYWQAGQVECRPASQLTLNF